MFQEFNSEEPETLTVNCDNQGSIALSKDNKFDTHTKHIDVRYHFIHKCVVDGKIKLSYMLTDDNLLDVFTKALPKLKFQRFVKMLGLKEIMGTSLDLRVHPTVTCHSRGSVEGI